MTNKTLSEQICEVCGIEALYHFYDESVDPILDEYLTKQEILEQYVSVQTPFEDYKKYEIYPDFENNNNNFVKLLELKILTGCTLWGFLSLKGVYMSKKETVLKTIYLILSNKIKFLDDKSREQIKKAIRQADWEV